MSLHCLNLLEVRSAKKLNQKQMGNLFGVPQTTYSNYERGIREIPLRHLRTLLTQHKININWLLADIGQMHLENTEGIVMNSIEVTEVLNRVRQKEGLGSEDHYGSSTRLANFLGISPQRLRQWVTRNTLDIDVILNKCPDYDLNWLFLGKTGADPVCSEAIQGIPEPDIFPLLQKFIRSNRIVYLLLSISNLIAVFCCFFNRG